MVRADTSDADERHSAESPGDSLAAGRRHVRTATRGLRASLIDVPCGVAVGEAGTRSQPVIDRSSSPMTASPRNTSRWRGFVARNALSLTCFAIFGVLLVAQSLTGWRTAVADAVQHGGTGFTYWRYLTTGHFAEATFENWECEFLQMGAFVLLTVFLIQKGSGESKQDHDDPRDEDPRTIVTTPTPHGRSDGAAPGSPSTRTVCLSRSPCCSSVRSSVTPSPAPTSTPPSNTNTAQPGIGAWQFVRHGRVLVPVVPELAERVPGRRHHRRSVGLPPPTRLRRVETSPRTAPRNG